MRKSRFTETQIVAILKAHDAGTPTAELARKHGIHPNTLRLWRAKYGGMNATDVAKVRTLTEENERLKRIVAELHLDNHAYKLLVEKNRLGPSQRKAAVRALQAEGVSEQRACKVVGCARSTVRYRVKRMVDPQLLERLRELAARNRRFGYRKLGIMPISRRHRHQSQASLSRYTRPMG